MNKNLIRLSAGFLVLVGLAYVGHEVFVNPGGGTRAAPAASASAAAASNLAAANAQAAATGGLSASLSGSRGYVVYPDRATENEFKLDYPTFSGNFAQDVTVTPLPPQFPGKVLLRLLPGKALAIEVVLNDLRCRHSVQVALYRINDRSAIASTALDAKQPKLSVPFNDGRVPALLAQIGMDETAQNNYWCGVTVRWVEQAPGPAPAAPAA